ncbi:mucoidy inhibitor MuiA family protein [Nannocystis sp.]|uniref:mucoidy inhibitor MuiA family protein n=1 Tax=Nannocystis sp. TaxID=1962667 RepID=UPI0024239366|nr:mucoidy inhibitor MuiA family protein [Nannocystis sp.]MBK7825279.1 mucoidy inhibitor MuiA family protein [Nannocystis sp.]MBK9756862.1 mucoidy inhibitor MuiA family protein [Nannocystis sp.]
MPEPKIVDKPSEDLASLGALILDLKAPVVEVTVLEDRAHVVRRGVVDLHGGITRLRVRGVAPVLADKTLCASVVQAGQKTTDTTREQIKDVRVKRARLVLGEDKPEQRRALEAELEQQQRVLEAQRARHEQLRGEQAALDGVADVTVTDIGVDVSYGEAAPEAWLQLLAQISGQEEAVRNQRLALEFDIAEQEQLIQRLRTRMAVTATVSDAAAAEVIVEVWAAAAGHYTVQVDYVVPGACWRPYHRAQLVELVQGKEPLLHFASEGCVWQNTGEDWTDVQFIFSTERPSLGMEPPPLSTEVLHAQRKSEVLVVEAREQEVQTTGLGVAPKQRTAELPGIDDGGEALKLRSTTKASVPGDGRPHRVPLMAFTSPTSIESVLMPELAEAVVLKSSHVNRSQLPILAGPVDLVREGGFVGRSSLLFIAPGENFAIGWGPDGAVRVQRSVELAKEDRGVMSSWVTQAHVVKVKISNLAAQERTVHVTERVPVSEIEKLRIEVDTAATSDKQKPDSNGFVHWRLELPAFGRKTLELRYLVRKHGDVVGI